MLSRHFLRAKVLQSVYAATLQQEQSVLTIEKNFIHNVTRLNDLSVMQLSMLLELRCIAEQVMEEGKNKFKPTPEERNPNPRIVENVFLCRMADNFEFRKLMEAGNVGWSDNTNLFRKVYVALRDMDIYKEYLASEATYENDRAFVLKLFKVLINDEALRDTFVERSLLWEDDYDQVAQYNFMMLKGLEDADFNAAMHWPLLYDEKRGKDADDMEFARHLLKVTLRVREESEALIKKHLQHWDFDRVVQMDVLLINMAVAELTESPSIPERVTVDEYIELSKEFSTDKSKLFINGMLDRILAELRASGRVQKSGRGLFVPED